MKFKRLYKKDISDMVELVKNTMPSLDKHAKACFTAPNALRRIKMWGLRDESGLIAMCGLSDDWMSWFAVRQDKQRMGLGGVMITHLLSECEGDYIHVETYLKAEFASANAFYLKHGFVFHGISLPDTIFYTKAK